MSTRNEEIEFVRAVAFNAGSQLKELAFDEHRDLRDTLNAHRETIERCLRRLNEIESGCE